MRMFTKKTARIRDKARKVAAAASEKAEKIDHDDYFPPELWDRLWESGYMTMGVPKEYGGGWNLTESVVVVEELARGCGAAGLNVLLQVLAAAAISGFASEDQAKELFRKIVDERQVCAFALSEPEPAPDSSGTISTARKSKSGYVLSGRKTFVSGAREADLVIVIAATNAKARLKKALSAFVIPAGTTGMLPATELSRQGLRGVPAVDLVFEGCKVDSSALLGRAGQGYEVARRATIAALPLAAALSCGLLVESVNQVVELARSRDPQSSPLSEFQSIELVLADMAAGLDAAVAMTWAAAGAVDAGSKEAEKMARQAKWTATEAAIKGTDAAAGLFGIRGAVQGTLLERLGRDARANKLVLGPNHLHRIEVARKMIRQK